MSNLYPTSWIRRALRRIRAKLKRSPAYIRNRRDLIALVRRSKAAAPEANGKRVYILMMRGWARHVALESILGARLQLDGHHVTFLLCEDSIPFCMYGSINSPPERRRPCEACIRSRFSVVADNFRYLSIPKYDHLEQDFLSQVEQLDLTGCVDFIYENAPYGQLLQPTIFWFLRRSRLEEDDCQFYKQAIIAAHTVRLFLENLCAAERPDVLVGLNGDFLAGKIAEWVLQRHGIRWITYDYTINSQVLVGVNTSAWNDLTFESRQYIASTHLDKAERQTAEKLLKSWRKKGGYQGQLFWTRQQLASPNTLADDLDKHPYAVAFTNLTFESSVVNKGRIFKTQFEWLDSLIEFFGENPNYRLLVRIHPAEVRDSHWRPRESLYSFLVEKGQLPTNITIIAPEDKTSSYGLATSARVILVYSSTIGLELVDRGKRVITAAHSHYTGRGFTQDPETRDDYFTAIHEGMRLPYLITTAEKNRERLIGYVAWLFSRRLIRFEPLTEFGETWPAINIKTPAALVSPHNDGLEKLCALVTEGCKWW